MGRGYRLLSICFLLTSSFYLLISAISPPSNLRVVNLRSNTVTVSWTSPTEPTDSFSISISPLDDGESALPQFFNSSHATWDNLVSGKEYTVEVRSVVDGEDPSLPAVLIITTVPASPYNIQVSKFVNPLINQYRVTGSKTMMYPVYGAVVSWEMPDMGMLDDFVLTVDPPHGSIRVPIKLKSGISSEARTEQRRIVWELLPGVAYDFTVQTKSNGVLSNPITGKERMPPEIPGSLTVEELKSTSVVISWEGNHRGILDGYAIETEPVGGIAVQISDDPLHQRRKVDNLIPGTTYDIEVYSTMDGLLSFKPSVIVINTPPATPRKEVKSEQITSESVFITWNPPPGQFEYYEIVYYPTDRDFGRLRERVWDARVNLTRLDPGSSYQVEIFSFGNDLFSEPLLETVYTRPLPPNKVKTTSTHDTIIMSWETVYFDGGAKIDYTIVGEENGTITKYLGPGITELSITELEPGSDYVINVFTVKNGVESDPVTVQTRTNPEPKAPPSDNIPVPPEAAATEKTVWTETTGTTAQTSTAAAATTTPAAIAGLVEETTAETENYKTTTTTAAAATTSQSTTTERVEKSTRKESKFTSVINTANPATQAAVGTPVATTASPIVTTTSVRGSAATEEQRSTTTNADATGTIRSQETTATYTTATNVTSETRAPTKSFDEDTTPTTRQFPAITKEAVTEQTTDNQREGKKSQSTTEAAKSQPSAITMSSTPTKATIDNTTASTADPAEPAARANQFTDAPSTIPSRSSSTTSETTTKSFAATTEATHATTNITIKYSEASRATTQEPETTYPPPFPDKENPGPPGDFKELNTTTSTITKATSKPSTTTHNTITEEEIIIEHDRETITIRNGFKTICKPNNITVFVDKNVIGKYESEFGPLHFNKDDGQNCKGVEYDKYYRYTLAPNILGCGTQFTVNDTHVNFTNTVSNRRNHDSWYADMLDPSGHILIGGTNIKPYPLVHMNFYCTFPLEMTVHTDLIPDLRVEVKTFNVSGVGEFSAIMQLFKDKQYQHPHFAAPSLTPDQLLRVGVTLLKTKDEDISIAVRKCWATPVRLYDYDTFYPLIENYCPQDGALNNNLTILENGKSKRSRWEGPVFKFVKYTEVWLHCELKVCFGDSCNTTCSQLGSPRARRSLNPTRGAAIVSAGPVFVKREEKIEKQAPKPPVNTDAQDGLQETTVIIIVAVLCAVIFLMCVLFVLIMVKCRRNRRDKDTDAITCPESFATSTLGSRRGEDAYWDADGQYKVRSSPVHNPNAPASIDPNLPPVPCISASGEFPDSFAVVEDVPSILAPTPNCYSNPTFDSKSENR
uniref:fibronectin-like isoform X2 n=1 Tax=Styela clava TaxID=7725 RepID=UPI00193A462B|nr:fibronectin-like isoform X2 [Styela clava]